MKVCYEYKDLVVRVLEHPIARQLVILLLDLAKKDNAELANVPVVDALLDTNVENGTSSSSLSRKNTCKIFVHERICVRVIFAENWETRGGYRNTCWGGGGGGLQTSK